MAFRPTCFVIIMLSGFAAAPAAAQTESEVERFVDAFSGDWFSFDDASRAGEACKVTLTDEGEDVLAASVSACDGSLSEVEAWTIKDGQIRLFDGPEGSEIAVLGGNQFRITGEVGESRFLVLERQEGDAHSRAIRNAISTYKCIYRGFSDECAKPEELRVPDFSDEISTRVRTIVNLNVRRQPRADADLVGTVEKDTLVTLESCLIASDGPWCTARFGGDRGWLARTALRGDTWPILTFVSAAEE